MSYMASIYGIMRYEPWELIQMQMTEGQGHLVQQSTFNLEQNGTATISVLGNSLRRGREIFTMSSSGEDLDKERRLRWDYKF